MMASRRRDPRSTLVSLVTDATKNAPPRPIEERGRPLYAEDVIELLASRGKTVTRWWVNHKFAPELAQKVGRANMWWEIDALKWLDAQKRGRPA
jgi:hypothetical protein